MREEIICLLKVYAELIYIELYSVVIVWLVLLLNLGVFSWVVVITCLTPPTVVWYVVVRRRVKNYLGMLMDNRPKIWDVEKSIKEYLEILGRKKGR